MKTNHFLAIATLGWALLLSACDPGPTPAPSASNSSPGDGTSGARKEAPSKAAAALRGGTGYEIAPVANPGALAATVIFSGDPIPEPAPVQVDADVPHCGQKVFTENLLVDRETRGLRNVIVRLEGIVKGKPPQDTVTITNKSCAFDPHVSVAAKGTRLAIRNADPILHTTHPFIAGSSFFSQSMATGEEPPPARPIPKAGLMEITCDVHKWMRGYMYVHTSPYLDVTDKSGKLRIEGIPPGKYSFVVWHESLGEKRGEVEIVAGQTAELKLEYSPPK